MTEEIKAGQIIEYDKDNTPHFIIDGVDVSECGFLDYHRPTKLLLCNECNSNFEAMECKDYHDCYYKQMKRLEQENKKLKEALEEIKEVFKKYDSEEEGTVAELLHDVFEVYGRVCEVLKDE